MNIKKLLAIFAQFVFIVLINSTFVHAEDPVLCKEGYYWTFDIKGENPILKRSDEVNGIYTARCVNSKLALDEGVLKHFVDVIPSVPGLTSEPPWFKFLEGQKNWDWEFEWAAPSRNNRVDKWVAHFSIVSQDGDEIKIIRKDEQSSGPGWRKYEYSFSKQTGSVTKMTSEWRNGATYKATLIKTGKEVSEKGPVASLP